MSGHLPLRPSEPRGGSDAGAAHGIRSNGSGSNGGHGTRKPSLDESYAHCVAITKRRARNFYIAFLTLPRPARRAICAIYAYCRRLDDIADGDAPVEEKTRAIAHTQDALLRSLDGDEATSPLFTAVAHTVRAYAIPRERLFEVAAGVTRDLYVTRYASFNDLKEYCYLVASSVGLACLEVFGYRSAEARQAAINLGVAMQLTNVLRDIAEDATRGRIYVPKEDMDRFGLDEHDLLAGRSTEAFRRMMAYQVERVRSYYTAAQPLFGYLPRRSRPCPMVLLGVYRRLLMRIEAREYDVFSRRVSLTKPERIRLALGLWMKGLLWKPPM